MMHLRTVFLGNMLLLSAPGLLPAEVAGPTKTAELSVTGRADKRLASLDRLMTEYFTMLFGPAAKHARKWWDALEHMSQFLPSPPPHLTLASPTKPCGKSSIKW